MFGTWWLVWMVFMFVFLLAPMGYGWGYRSWGPPYPRYIQRRRALRAGAGGPATAGSAAFDHHAWGWGGDFVWMVLLVGAFWFALALWWR